MDSYIAGTFDLTQYTYAIEQLPHMTPEETAILGQRILQANRYRLSWAEGMAARDAIIQGHLHLVLSLAKRYPYELREDLIQEGNIGLIEAVEHYQFHDGCDFTSYAVVAIRHAFAAARESVLPIRVPRSSMRVAQSQGTADRLYAMQPISLDRPRSYDDSEVLSLADTLPAIETATADITQEQASVDALLNTLPETVRQVIELRYGLAEQDQRQHSYAEVADELGISKSYASKLEREGLAQLKGNHLTSEQLRQMAQESRLNAAYSLLQQGRTRISIRKLARAAKVRSDVAAAYLQRAKATDTQQDAQAKGSGLSEKSATKLLQAYRCLQAQSDTVSVLALQKAAGVHWNTAKKFLEQLRAQERDQARVGREAVEA